MSRHRRAMSDLHGLKSAKTLPNEPDKQCQKTLDSHNLSIYQPKTASAKLKKSYCPETTVKQGNSQEMIVDTYKLLKHFYQNEQIQYFERVRKYLSGEWQGHKKNFNQHLNKLTYMEEEMQKRNYNEIQLEVVGEWRKNHVLYCIRAFWYEHISKVKFGSIGDFMKKYNLFKDFVGQLAFLYFKRFFSQKQNQKILDKLTDRTSHLIITHTKTWSNICDVKVIPLIKIKLSSNVGDIQSSSFDLTELGIKTIAVDVDAKEMQMKNTADSIQKFILQHKILDKMTLLIDVRLNMEKQIRARQQKLISDGLLNQIKVLDKDDFVDCLVYCVVKGDISLQDLGASIKYFYYILGADAHNILSKFRCDPYLADLEAVYDFLILQGEKQKNAINNSIL